MNVIAINPRTTIRDPREATPVFGRTFDGRVGVDFSALNEAEAFLTARGFSFGPGSIGDPQGILFGREWQIAKWRNLTLTERNQLHGTVSGDRRKGPVRVAIFWNAPAFAIAAVAEPHIADLIVSTWATQR